MANITLGDDGTMDTVLVCADCGAEMRYSYTAEDDLVPVDIRQDAPGGYWRVIRDGEHSPKGHLTEQGAEEEYNRECYGHFVEWAIEGAENEHECPRYSVQAWFERDRAHVALYFGPDGDANDTLIIEWWDEAVAEAVEDGFLSPRDWLGSALDYARSLGMVR